MRKPPRPVYAGVRPGTESKSPVFIVMFGRNITIRTFTGHQHKIKANEWARGWERFLMRGWDDMTSNEPGLVQDTKAAAADVMENFCKSLREQGVAEKTIQIALKRTRNHA